VQALKSFWAFRLGAEGVTANVGFSDVDRVNFLCEKVGVYARSCQQCIAASANSHNNFTKNKSPKQQSIHPPNLHIYHAVDPYHSRRFRLVGAE
jgi:hypothetical protein